MCKSSSLGFVLLFAFMFKLERPTWRLVGIIGLITLGVILMVSGETRFSFIGMVEVLTASCMSGLRWALTQKLLDKEAMGLNNPFATLFWLCPIMAVTLAVCSLIIEGPFQVFADERFWGTLGATMKTALLICAPGILAFFMTTSEFACVRSHFLMGKLT
jgi:solute carrier family 35 protein C2